MAMEKEENKDPQKTAQQEKSEPEKREKPREEDSADKLSEKDLTIDGRLLAEAVIELNISRRNVALYPPGHVRIVGTINSAHEHLEKLFEIRPSITLGITKDSIVIDKKVLDSKNPVFRDCARSFHHMGIAAIEFRKGVRVEELVSLNELMTMKDPPTAADLVEAARERGIAHLVITPLDHSSFAFIEDEFRGGATGGGVGRDVVDDYVYSLLDGTLAGAGSEGVLMGFPPMAVAEAINKADIKDPEAYDRVIKSYLATGAESELSAASLKKLSAVVDGLSSDKKEQFLSSAMKQVTTDMKGVESALRDMTNEDMERMARLFREGGQNVPSSLKQLVDKLSTLRTPDGFNFDIITQSEFVVHDIEVGKDITEMFTEDNFESFVSAAYQNELSRMMEGNVRKNLGELDELVRQGREDVIDRAAAEIMIEVLESNTIKQREEFMNIVTNITGMAGEFVDTGRFEDTLNIYTALYSYSFNGRYKHEAESTVQYFFRTEEFAMRVMNAVLSWGRQNRDSVARLARALKSNLIRPFINALIEEPSMAGRRFIISVLAEIGPDILPDVFVFLGDDRWYVARNMILLVRRVGRAEHAERVKPFLKHKDHRVWAEAIRTLIAFRNPHGVPHLRVYMQSEDMEVRDHAVKLAGSLRLRDVVPLLIEIVNGKDLFGALSFYKIAAVKALGDIGDPRAIAPLEKIVHSRKLLYKGFHDDLKLAVYRSLGGYPRKSLGKLIDIGLESPNQEIASICMKLLRTPESKQPKAAKEIEDV